MRDAFILDGIRTPFGKREGSLKDWRPDDLLGYTVQQFVARSGVDARLIEDLIVGCVTQVGEQGVNVARMSGLIAGLPLETGGVTLNRMCGSGQQATNFAAMAVKSEEQDLVLAGGVESMSRVPISSDVTSFSDKLQESWDVLHQGESAERICDKWGITRGQLDEFALASHRKAVAAQDRGFFAREILPTPTVPWDASSKKLEHDELPRRETSLEKLGKLKPVFRDNGRITAGSSSGINDAAGVILVGSKDAALRAGLDPRARIVATAVSGVDPEIMLTGPIPATRKVLEKAKLKVKDIDTFEVNEAFASVPLAWLAETGVAPDKLNPNGGAIAIGHPLGASGIRLLLTAVNQLERTGGRYGLVTMCIGFGQATATVVERV